MLNQNKKKTLVNLSWNDKLTLIDHYHPSLDDIVDIFGITPNELDVARGMLATGTFSLAANLNYSIYDKIFRPVAVECSTISTAHRITSTVKTQPINKRGRKGSKISDAFAAIPNKPTDALAFAASHQVSISVLRQSKRFDQYSDLGCVKSTKDKSTNTLMIWRESN